MGYKQMIFNLDVPAKPDSKQQIQLTHQYTRGAVWTCTYVVECILDLVGYIEDQPLHTKRALEPACGEGAFLLPMIERLIRAWKRHGGTIETSLNDLSGAICAIEIHPETFLQTQHAIKILLLKHGLPVDIASTLASHWLINADALLVALEQDFDIVVGNPPYVRQDRIPSQLLILYREKYSTIYDRADLYIPFIERALTLLSPHGLVGFICPNRWLTNRYGERLRAFIADQFHLKFYIDMTNVDAFESSVTSYPAIVVFSRGSEQVTRAVINPPNQPSELRTLTQALCNQSGSEATIPIQDVKHLVQGSVPWVIRPANHLSLLRRLESEYPLLETVGCQVGIGVATGADAVLIQPFVDLDVEPDRKLPLAMTRDLIDGMLQWHGAGVINPFDNNGKLVDLQLYPRLRAYLESHRVVLSRRHCAKKNPAAWYRTIDRIHAHLTTQPKLLIPDIKGKAQVVYENGQLYPHHNLYYILSMSWDLYALQALLSSPVTLFLIDSYTTKLRGGYLRFQAQYLRRLRLPLWDEIAPELQQVLINAGRLQDPMSCFSAVCELYKLRTSELKILGMYKEDVYDS